MCGIAGFYGSHMSGDMARFVACRMANAIRHRGPDDLGSWVNQACGVALSQCRLAILDLSSAGHQPMTSASGRYTFVFNGEIYNFQELREELATAHDIRWRGHSDSEVLLAAFDEWGVAGTLPVLNGMFAFAAWDREERVLYLARDRMGEKPLYYSWQKGTLVFGSEIKALLAYPGFYASLSRDALALFFRHSCIPAPYTIYQDVWKLPPATYAKISSQHTTTRPVAYWSAREAVDAAQCEQIDVRDDDVIEALDLLLGDAVQLRMISDVSLGAFLSGGIDSSLITALMQARSTKPVRSFSIGFCEDRYNEASNAKAVAQHLGTDHTELYVTPAEALDVIPSLSTIYDEPFSDSSEISTYLLARLTRQHVTVALSGDGGDELFGGYNRHVWVGRVWKAIGWLPAPARAALARAITAVAPQHWDKLFYNLGSVLPDVLQHRLPGAKLHKLAGALSAADVANFYRAVTSHWTDKESLVLGAVEPITQLTESECWTGSKGCAEQMMFLDSVTYLPDDILVKVDRATMAASLEGRIPYLDHRVFDFAWKMPLRLRLRRGRGKWILRKILARYVPPTLTDRPKTGFEVPIDSWLRGPLRDWAEALLDERRLSREGILNPTAVRQRWTEHLSGRCNWQHHLWDVLVFQMWSEAQTQVQAGSMPHLLAPSVQSVKAGFGVAAAAANSVL